MTKTNTAANANTNTKPATLILGGTGKTGRRIAERLTARGRAVRIGSRSAEPAFDWDDRATWAPALQGVDAVYVSFYPDIAVPGAPETIRAFAELAVTNGVRRMVLLSGRGEAEAQRAEEMLKASGADWTILRCSWFCQNFNESFLLDPVLSGEVALPAGTTPEPFVDADDIADVVVAALTDDRHVRRLYELTGPRLLSFRDAVAEIGAAAGRDISFVSVPLEDYTAMLTEYGLPQDFIWLLIHLFTEVLGSKVQLGDGVQRALGREPKDFAEYVREAAATGVWTPSV
jgi:uncharacterized protein YbjT (DUF2867 family)